MTQEEETSCPTVSTLGETTAAPSSPERGRSPSGGEDGAAGSPKRPKRWSAARKHELVLRLFRGESLDQLSRETGLPAHRIAQWRDAASQAMQQALKASARRTEADLEQDKRELQRKLGEVTMEAELLQAQVDKLKAGVPFAKRGRWKR